MSGAKMRPCRKCPRGVTWLEDGLCRLCRHKDAKEKAVKDDEVKR